MSETLIRAGLADLLPHSAGYFQQNRAFVSGIRDATLTGVEQDVCVDENDQVGPCSISSRRFKEQIRELGSVSSRLLQLRPVLFKYKPEVKGEAALEQFGLIAGYAREWPLCCFWSSLSRGGVRRS